MKKYLLLFFLSFNFFYQAQTVGTISITNDVYDGYTLFTAFTETYLMNNCGQVINQWSSTFPPGNAVYLRNDGSILRAGRTNSTDIQFGGQGGVVEIFDWDGNLTWQYFYDTPQFRQHHDVFPMPNGNVLVLAATVMTNAEAIQAGRDPNQLLDGVLYNEQITEVTPIGSNFGNIVWEWNVKDHFIQDFDNSKDNFGDVGMSSGKLDLNFLNGLNPVANWLHINSIQYDETLDQIVISSRNMDEIYIIDHSTTTSEAATSSGGIYGKGGDFLYRWGNPLAYRQGTTTDAKLFGQHYPHYIRDYTPDNGKIIIFNNGRGRTPEFSQVDIITPPTTAPGVFIPNGNSSYGPVNTDYTYIDPVNQTDFFSAIVSSAQRLPNGNTLVCQGRGSYFFELDTNDNIVWEYISPVPNNSTSPVSQGSPPSPNNLTFRAIKYPTNHPAFNGRDITPGSPIELNPNISACLALNLDDNQLAEHFDIFPNPSQGLFTVKSTFDIESIEVYNLLGAKIKTITNSKSVDLSNETTGVYFLKLLSQNRVVTKKVLKR